MRDTGLPSRLMVTGEGDADCEEEDAVAAPPTTWGMLLLRDGETLVEAILISEPRREDSAERGGMNTGGGRTGDERASLSSTP